MYKLTTAATITTLFIVPGLSAPVFNAASGVERLERREYGYGGYGGGGYAAVPEVFVPTPAPYYAPPPPPVMQPYAAPMMSPYSQGMQGYPQPGGMQQKPTPNGLNGGQGAQHPHDHPHHPSQLSQDHPHHPSQLSQDHLPQHERHPSLAGGASQLSHQHQHHSSFASPSELSQTLGPHAGTGHHSHAGDLAMSHYPDHHGHDHLSATAGGLNGLQGAQHHGQHTHDPHHLSQQLGLSSQQPGLPGQQQHHHQQQHALHPGQHHTPTDHTYPGSSAAGDLAYGSHNHGPHAPLAPLPPLPAHLNPHPHGATHTHNPPHPQTHYRRSLDFMD